MKKILKIRADGSTEIGLGHLIRCIALAEMLQDDFLINFSSRAMPQDILETIRNKGYSFTKLNNDSEFINSLSGQEIVVLDSYKLGSEYQKEVKKTGCKLICVDDLKKNVFYADLIINFSPGVTKNDYKAQPYTTYALGPGFALLRPGFLEAAQKKRRIDNIESILICFGGSDFKNITQKVLSVTAKFRGFKEITVVVGSAYRNLHSLRQMEEKFSNVRILSSLNEKEMVEIIESTDLAVVSSSSILLEVIAGGSIPIISCYAENQMFLFNYFKKTFSIDSFNSLSFDEKELYQILQDYLSGEKKISEPPLREEIKNSKDNILTKIKSLAYG